MANRTTRAFGAAPAKKKRSTPLRSNLMDTKNAAGHGAFSRPEDEEYLKVLLTNVFGQTYYVAAEDQYSQAIEAHEKMVKSDPEFMSKALPYARNRGYMRTQPAVGLATLAVEESAAVRAANARIETERKKHEATQKALVAKGGEAEPFVIPKVLAGELRDALAEQTNYFEPAFEGVVNIPNDLMDFATIVKSKTQGEGGRRIKRVAGAWLRDHLDEFWAIKYGADKQGGYALRDLIKTYHPRGAKSEVVKYLLDDPKNPADLSKLPKIKAFEDLKKATTYTGKAEAIKAGRLPHEVVTPFIGSDSELWEVLAAQMPIFAFLRNLATFERHGVLDKPAVRTHAEKLFEKESVQKSKILPFRFVEAEKHVKASWMKKLLEKAVDYAFDSIPDIEGRTAVFLDRSGSMGGGAGSFMQIGALYGVCLMKKLKTDGRFLLFDDQLEEITVSPRAGVMPQVNAIHSRGGTSTNLPMEKLHRDKDKVDNIILITDSQQNAGAAFINVFDRYKRDIAPNVKLFIINVASYSGGLTPKGDKNVYYITGWSDKVLQFISLASVGFDSMAQAIRDGVV